MRIVSCNVTDYKCHFDFECIFIDSQPVVQLDAILNQFNTIMPTKTQSNKSEKPEKAKGTRSPRSKPAAPVVEKYVTPPPFDWQQAFAELTDKLNRDVFGLVLLVLGGYLLFTTWLGDPAWIEGMVGWTAPLTSLAVMILGAVMIFERRLGYWSAEALVGAESLLLALQSGSFVLNNPNPVWPVLDDGRNGGMIGWALGSLLVAGLGQWPALLLVALLGSAGTALLLRYTPLIYVSAQVGRTFPFLHDLVLLVKERISTLFPEAIDSEPEPLPPWNPPSRAENFVDAHANPALEAINEEAEQAWHKVAPLRTVSTQRRPANPITGLISQSKVEGSKVDGSKVDGSKVDGSKVEAQAKETAKPPAPKPSNPPVLKPLRTPDMLPAIDMLQIDDGKVSTADVRALQAMIEKTLDDFNVPVKVVHVESGPTVTQFGVEPLYTERAGTRRKVRVSRIVNLADDLALALAAPAVRIEAPVPGRPYVGIEVPNPEKTVVGLRGIMESAAMRKDGGMLGLPLGRNTAGHAVAMDMVRAPHLLIAGSTGSGKSVCLNTIITGLLMQHGPESLRFVMVDPKMVELVGFNGIPHLLGKVITDIDQVMGALTWLLIQMDERYRLFREVGVRNLQAYSEKVRKQKKNDTTLQPLPYIVLIIDELADLMMTAAEDIERQICRLAQMARATGIHLILATQRPSVNVVTGLIKANFPSRIAFAVTSQIDSRVILDTPGAERLLGRGDMLLMRSDSPNLQRIQGCYVHDDEINAVVNFWKAQAGEDGMPIVPPWNGLIDSQDEEGELVEEAIELMRGMKTVSTSLLQRKLQLGYPKAVKLMENLEGRGLVGPDAGGGRGREVLIEAGEESSEAST